MKNKKIFCLIGIILIIILVIVFMMNKKDNKEEITNIKKVVEQGKTAVIYVENSREKENKELRKYLDKRKIEYILYDTKKYSKEEYKKMLQSIQINPNDFNYPGVIYIKEGEVYADKINIKEEKELETFIKEYDLEKIK